MANTSERPLSPSQVAHLFGVSVTTVANWADEGKLPSFRTPGGQRRFLREDVEAFLSVRQAPDPEAATA